MSQYKYRYWAQAKNIIKSHSLNQPFSQTFAALTYFQITIKNAPLNNQGPLYPQLPPGTAIPPGSQQPVPVQQVIVQAPIQYGKDPITMKCFHCQAQIQTSTSTSAGPMGK